MNQASLILSSVPDSVGTILESEKPVFESGCMALGMLLNFSELFLVKPYWIM